MSTSNTQQTSHVPLSVTPTVETTVRGPIDSRTGMVMNISDLKSIIQQKVVAVLDHKNLDKDVPAFRYGS